jgi:hypothetical protein
MDSHQTFPGTERTPAAVVAELQYGPTMVSGPYRKRNGNRHDQAHPSRHCPDARKGSPFETAGRTHVGASESTDGRLWTLRRRAQDSVRPSFCAAPGWSPPLA